MLLSPRPTTYLPSAGLGDYNRMKPIDRATFIPRADGIVKQSPRQITFDTSANTIIPNASMSRESPRRSTSRRSGTMRITTPEPPRVDSTGSMMSRGSGVPMNRSLSRDSTTSMKRSLSRDSTTAKKGAKKFVVKSKGAHSVLHRPPSSSQLARTPSTGKVASLHPLTRSDRQFVQTAVVKPLTTGSLARQRVLSMSGHGEAATPPLIRRTLSEGNGARIRRSSAESTQLTRPRRSSNLSREANLDKSVNQHEVSVVDSSDDSEVDEKRLEIPLRRPLLEEPTPRMRKPSERSPPTPPTLQLRRTSANPSTTIIPRPVSGLAAVAHTPPQFAQLTHPGPGPAAPPYLTTTSAVVTDLPYAALTVGSLSSVKERLTQLQQGNLNFDDSPQNEPTSNPDGESPSNERNSANPTTSDGKPISLENTRYALSPEAHNMIRRLSNGPPGLRRPSSPSSPPMPSGWTRSEKPTRTMQKQVMYRDLEQEAFESQQFSPMIIRPDSRNDYFVPDHHHQVASNSGVEEDPFLSTYPKLNQELRRITKELNNVKKFSDPVADALQRLRERTGEKSPIANMPSSSSSSSKNPGGDSKFSLSGSWMKRFSPDRRETTDSSSSPVQSLRKNSLPSRLIKEDDHNGDQNHQDGGVSVFNGEQESKLREVTRQLWFSWPERPTTTGTAGAAAAAEDNEDGTAEFDIVSRQGVNRGTTSPTEIRDLRIQRVVSAERRSFGSGLRQTWGSALALAGLR